MGSLIKYRGTQERIEQGFEYKVSLGCCIITLHAVASRSNCVVLVCNSPGPH